MELFKSAKDADLGAISKLLKHSLAFISPEQYVEKLSYPEPEIRAIAVYGLGVLQRKGSLEYVINTLRNDENEIVRTSSIIALSFFKKLDILDRVLFSLYDESDMVKLAAIDLLTRHKYIRAKDKIINNLASDNDHVKLFVLDYVATCNLVEYKEKVFNLLNDKSPVVIQNAIVTLIILEAFEYKAEILERFKENHNPLIKMAIDWLIGEKKIERDITKY